MASSSRAGLVGSIVMFVVLQPLLAQKKEESHRTRLANPQTILDGAERDAARRLKANPRDSEALRKRGLARLQAGKLTLAIADLQHAGVLEPASAEVREELAFALILDGRYSEALGLARAALALDPQRPAAHAYAGHVLLRMGGTLPEALNHLQTATQRLPRNVDVHFDLLEAYRQTGDFPRALAELRRLRFLLEPTDARVLYQEGLLQADLGNLPLAINRFRAALAEDPRNPGARRDLGAVLIEAQRPQEALEILRPLAAEQPGSSAVAYFHALALANLERWPEAESEVRRSLSLEGASIDGRLLLGRVLSVRGHAAEAIAEFRGALRQEPGNLEVQLQLGEALIGTGELQEALKVLQDAVRQAPGSAAAHLQLAQALRLAGREAEALQASAMANRLQTKSSEARETNDGTAPQPQRP